MVAHDVHYCTNQPKQSIAITIQSVVQVLLQTYQIYKLGPTPSGSSGSLLSSLRQLRSYLALTQQGHKHRHSHCLAACTTKILKSSSNCHFSFDSTARSVPQDKILKIPRERAAQCACAGTYSVCIAPTQPAQRNFEKSRQQGRHTSSKAGKGLMAIFSILTFPSLTCGKLHVGLQRWLVQPRGGTTSECQRKGFRHTFLRSKFGMCVC